MDQLSRQALSLWPELAKQAGLEVGAWKLTPVWRRQDARVDVIVLRADGSGGSYVFKVQGRPHDPEGFAEAMQAQLEAHDAFPAGVPALYAVDFEAQACVMGFVDAVPLAKVLEGVPFEAQAGILRQAGDWLGRFHKATQVETRVFQPKYTLGYLEQIIAEIEDGARTVVDPQGFLDCARSLCDRQYLYEGRKTLSARTHGDLHMRNLLMGQDVVGIDFSSLRDVPVGHDIGRLLSDYAILRAPVDEIQPGHVLPEGVSDAFFEGYGLVGPQDPSVRLLIRHRILAEWWGLPSAPHQRSDAQERRWQGIRALAGRVFEDR